MSDVASKLENPKPEDVLRYCASLNSASMQIRDAEAVVKDSAAKISTLKHQLVAMEKTLEGATRRLSAANANFDGLKHSIETRGGNFHAYLKAAKEMQKVLTESGLISSASLDTEIVEGRRRAGRKPNAVKEAERVQEAAQLLAAGTAALKNGAAEQTAGVNAEKASTVASVPSNIPETSGQDGTVASAKRRGRPPGSKNLPKTEVSPVEEAYEILDHIDRSLAADAAGDTKDESAVEKVSVVEVIVEKYEPAVEMPSADMPADDPVSHQTILPDEAPVELVAEAADPVPATKVTPVPEAVNVPSPVLRTRRVTSIPFSDTPTGAPVVKEEVVQENPAPVESAKPAKTDVEPKLEDVQTTEAEDEEAIFKMNYEF